MGRLGFRLGWFDEETSIYLFLPHFFCPRPFYIAGSAQNKREREPKETEKNQHHTVCPSRGGFLIDHFKSRSFVN